MKKLLSFLFFNLLFNGFLFSQTPSKFIHVDQFGYSLNATKVAVLSDPQIGFNASESYSAPGTLEVRDVTTNSVVYTGEPSLWNGGNTHTLSGDKGWWFDFTSITTSGTYYIYDATNDERSAEFEIKENPYEAVLTAAGRMFFYNRCNFPKETPYADEKWADGNNFLNNLQDANCRYIEDPNNASLEKDLSGGWFDAGDYNKYVTFSASVIHNLLWSYQENPQAYGDNWNIPESNNNIADILDEVKWELEWLQKMNNPDGSTHIKMGSPDHNTNISNPPSANNDPRFYGPTCTSASIAIAGMFAHAAKVYQEVAGMETFAQELETAAVASWNYVLPSLSNGQLEFNCDDGSIISGDADWNEEVQLDYAVVAAIHLFDLTGEDAYHQYILNNANSREPIQSNFWGVYKMPLNDALLHYTSHNNANASLSDNIKNAFSNDQSGNGNGYYGFNASDLYRAAIPAWSYHWGSNLTMANYGSLNQLLINYEITNPSSFQSFNIKTAAQLHYFHGVNPLGIVYLSNMYTYGGDICVDEMYHTWFTDGSDYDNVQTSLYGPAPGYVVGGPNKSFSVGTISPPSGQPAQKSYLDWNTGWPQNSWEITEPAIYYQAAYLRLLANFVEADNATPIEFLPTALDIQVFPNPTKDVVNVLGDFENVTIELLDQQGRVLQMLENQSNKTILTMTEYAMGMYFIKISDKEKRNILTKKIIKPNH